MPAPSGYDLEVRARFACIYSGVIWGVFWIPLRMLDRAGIEGAWATVLFYLVPLLCLLPWMLRYWKRIRSGGIALQLIGLSSGCALALYADAMLYTEVVRGMLLYYLTPIWSMLLARIVLGEAITGARRVAIVLGLAGMLVIFGIDQGLPWPKYLGDWMGLLGGILWAVAAVLLRRDDGKQAFELTAAYFFWGSVAAIALAFSPLAGDIQFPAAAQLLALPAWFIPLVLLLVIPASYAAIWGAPHLNPGVVGLLFMTEISVGAITAAIWAGEPFGWREIIGVTLITLAGLSEWLMPMLRRIWPAVIR